MTNWKHSDLLRANPGASEHREHSEAMYLTSSFKFENAAQAAEYFGRQGADYIYSRFSNPTTAMFNQRMALLEGAEAALATASGMAAITAVVMALCQAGDRVLCSRNVFGATIQLLSGHLAKFDIQVEYVNGNRLDRWRQAAMNSKAGKVALMIVETPSNPMQEVMDLAGLAQIAKESGALLVVDNCFCAGCQQPLRFGADLVVHSATKYPDGQGRVLGGSIVGSNQLLMEKLYPFLRASGPALSPFNAWVISKSLETLPLRIKAHSATALQIAQWLEQQPAITKVWHTALPSHPAHTLAMQQQAGLGGGLITCCLSGGKEAAWRFMDALRLFSITANFGDAKSIVAHPASTTHSRLTAAEQAEIGLDDSIVRLSIGLEAAEDLQADIEQALAN
ncbi:MAG: O-succinylhomoserine sulfhydrylase [Proteobacteria bacterium]|nr:O-succinylhomoserine sulfhydrylase [Pseudomonadota bacterium]